MTKIQPLGTGNRKRVTVEIVLSNDGQFFEAYIEGNRVMDENSENAIIESVAKDNVGRKYMFK